MPPFSAPLINKYKEANGIIMGKTAVHELSAGGTSVGPTSNNLSSILNPWKVTHHAGGAIHWTTFECSCVVAAYFAALHVTHERGRPLRAFCAMVQSF